MKRPRFPRSLRGRLTAGLVVLLALACAAVGVTTVLALEGFLVRRLDQQLTASGGRFAASLEHEERPDADNIPDTRGQAEGTFGARLLDGRVTDSSVVRERSDVAVPLSPGDQRELAKLAPNGAGRSIRLTSLGEYRVQAVAGDDGDVLVTGLPLHPVEETLHKLEAVEIVVFGIALIAAGAAAAWWVGFTLRPLRRVAATATAVTRLPLAGGDVAMPEPLKVDDPRTEVGQVATALNRMMGHVGDALRRRQASEERLRSFAADASHELRTPVATVRAHAELALRRPEPMPAEARDALHRIQSESRRMSVLVDELLLLARLDAGRPLAREPVDLSRLVLDAVDDARTVGPGHRWVLDLPAEPVEVSGDPHSLHQVVANLLANADAHTPAGTTVTVTLSPSAPHQGPAEHVELTVEDDGPGIPEALLPNLFERFTRADASRTRTGGGTGLGLAIVHAVVGAHGGTVDVTSRPGRTRFRLRLPAEGADGAPA
ncbi:MAG: HAMP domain-containing protein [Streptomycetaceae bacterium]|nr:HAMP domain-containing protein [Streptomycetaceae bacterium]NUS56638.1 HAMP domain-containing protein [Streptomycetaceae bacterium]